MGEENDNRNPKTQGSAFLLKPGGGGENPKGGWGYPPPARGVGSGDPKK